MRATNFSSSGTQKRNDMTAGCEREGEVSLEKWRRRDTTHIEEERIKEVTRYDERKRNNGSAMKEEPRSAFGRAEVEERKEQLTPNR
jgi:hypothetical protein